MVTPSKPGNSRCTLELPNLFSSRGAPLWLISRRIGVNLNQGNGSFFPRATYQAGWNATSVATGDFNADGFLDLAVAYGEGASNPSNGGLAILLNQKDGTFARPATYEVYNGPHAVAVGDFNGDGAPDVAVAGYQGFSLSVLQNAGDGTFAAAVYYPASPGPMAVAVGDWNADGCPDIVVANYLSANVGVFLNDCGGNFSAQVTHAVGSGPEAIAAGDFNRDGLPDIAVTNANDNTVSVLFSQCR
jgi:hypothetical protein